MKESCVSFSCGVKKPPNPSPSFWPCILRNIIDIIFCHLDDQVSHMCISSQNVKLNFQQCCNNRVKHACISPELKSSCTNPLLTVQSPQNSLGISALLGGGNPWPIIMGKLNSMTSWFPRSRIWLLSFKKCQWVCRVWFCVSSCCTSASCVPCIVRREERRFRCPANRFAHIYK